MSRDRLLVLPSIVSLLAVGHAAHAGTAVYKCIINGQTTLTDKSCPGDKSADGQAAQPSTIVASSKEPSPVGKWTGQLQYSEISNGQAVQTAHSVALMNAEFTADGKVSGVSAENGCHLLGVWSQGQGTIQWLDITLSGCSYAGLNRRYHGSLILARPDSSGNLAAQALGTPFGPDTGKAFDIKGTLRR